LQIQCQYRRLCSTNDHEPVTLFVYWSSRLTGLARDDVEEAVEEALGDAGMVTGAGSGRTGSNIDADVYGDHEEALAKVRLALSPLSMPEDTVIVMGGKRHPLR